MRHLAKSVLYAALLAAAVACGGAAAEQRAPAAAARAHDHAGHHPPGHDEAEMDRAGHDHGGQAAASGSRPTEGFRAHHAQFHAELERISEAAMTLSSAPRAEVGERLERIVHFLRHELIPHAQAEERVLYAVADRIVPTEGGRRYTDSLRYEHTVVLREVQALHDAMERGDHSAGAIADFQRRTIELVGLVKAHFGAEEDVILVAFDERMSPEEFEREVAQPMHAAGGEAAEPAHAHR